MTSRRAILIFLLLAHSLSVTVSAEEIMRNLLHHACDSGTLTLGLSDGTLALTLLSDQALEAVFTPAGEAPPPPSRALAAAPAPVEARLVETPETLSLLSAGLAIEIRKSPFRLAYRFKDRPLIEEEQGFFQQNDSKGFRFRLADGEKLFGGGSRALGKMDRRGERLELYNSACYNYEETARLMYYSMPAVISTKKYMLVFDNTARGAMDLDSTGDGILQFETGGGRMAYLLIAGESWPDLAGRIADTTGHQPLLPRWALGTIASRMAYRSRAEVESVVAGYRRTGFPLDAVVLDLYWFGPDLRGYMGNLDWDLQAFPEPEAMLANLARQGVQTVLITEPLILTDSTNWSAAAAAGVLARNDADEPYTFDSFFGRAGLIDIFAPAARTWFWNAYRKHTASGVAGWWGDLGEPETHPGDIRHADGCGDELHNAFGHEWARLVHEGFQRDFPDRRLFNLMRAGFVGSQRYGILPWSGDVQRSWGGFQPQVELALQMGLQGVAWMHSDLGGFAGDLRDPELYARWLQYGTFQPIHRPHAHETVPAEPIFWDKATQDIVRPYVRLRYRLLPYNYTLMFENATAGLPLMRPLMYLDERPEMEDCRDTFLWGDAFLVAPVMEKGATARAVPLPRNATWFNWWTGTRHEGGQTLTVPVTLENIPVFVKAGAFVPMTQALRHTGQFDAENLQVHFYADRSVQESSGQFYDDDGRTPAAYANKQYERVDFRFRRPTAGEMEFSVSGERHEYPGRPETRTFLLVIHALDGKPAEVLIDGQKTKTAAWNEATGLLTVPVRWNGRPRTVTLPAG